MEKAYVAFTPPDGRTTAVEAKIISNLTTEQIVSILRLEGQKLFIHTPQYVEYLPGNVNPVHDYSSLCLTKKPTIFERPDYFLTCYPAEMTNFLWLKLNVENDTKFEIPPFYVEFDLSFIETMTGTDLLCHALDALDLGCTSSELLVNGDRINLDAPARRIINEWKASSATLRVTLSADAIKKMTKRTYVLKEIITTEETYIKDLTSLLTIWKPELEKQGIITRDDLQAIFKELPGIKVCHSTFYDDLVAAGTTYEAEFGVPFIEFSHGFKVSQQFIGNFASVTEIMTKYQKNKKVVAKLLEISEREGSKDFGSYLITPVQRMPRYVLFLRDLIKVTPKSHPDHQPIQEAFIEIEDVTRHIDSVSAFNKKMAAIVKLQNSITNGFNVTSVGRELVLRKPAKIGNRNVKPGTAFLFNDLIVFVKGTDSECRVVYDSEIAKFSYRNQFPTMSSITVDATGKPYLPARTGNEYQVTFEKTQDVTEFLDMVKRLQQSLQLKSASPYVMLWDTLMLQKPLSSISRPVCASFDSYMFILSPSRNATELFRLVVANGVMTKENVKLPVMKSPRMIVFNRSLFIFGGPKLIRFDPFSSKIENIDLDVPIRPASGCSCVIYGSKVFIFGGKNSQREYLSDFYSIDLTTNTVTTIPRSESTPSARWHHSAVVRHDTMFIFGGKSSKAVLNDVHSFDFATGEWTRIPSALSARKRHMAIVVGKSMIIFGGDRPGLATESLNLVTGEVRQCSDFGNCPPLLKYGDVCSRNSQVFIISSMNIYRITLPAVISSFAMVDKHDMVDHIVSDSYIHARECMGVESDIDSGFRQYCVPRASHPELIIKLLEEHSEACNDEFPEEAVAIENDITDPEPAPEQGPEQQDAEEPEPEPQNEDEDEEEKEEEPELEVSKQPGFSTASKIAIAATTAVAVAGIAYALFRRYKNSH